MQNYSIDELLLRAAMRAPLAWQDVGCRAVQFSNKNRLLPGLKAAISESTKLGSIQPAVTGRP